MEQDVGEGEGEGEGEGVGTTTGRTLSNCFAV